MGLVVERDQLSWLGTKNKPNIKITCKFHCKLSLQDISNISKGNVINSDNLF